MVIKKVEKGEKVFQKDQKTEEGVFFVLLSTDIVDSSDKKIYLANTIV